MKIVSRCFSVALIFLIAIFSVGIMVSADELSNSVNKTSLQGDTSYKTRLNDPSIEVYVDNTFTTDATGTKYKYEVYVNTYAGNLGTVAGTKYNSLVIKTSSNGSTLKTFSSNTYYYSGTSYNSHYLGYFYRSINSPLTSVYAYTSGACVYSYYNEWLSIYDFSGTITIYSPSKCMVY